MKNETVFSCGTQAADWIYNNCEQCKKYDHDSAENTDCDFSNKLCMGFFGKAPTVDEFKKFGFDGNANFKCSQLVPIDE